MNSQNSLKKRLAKAALSLIAVVGAVVAFAGFSDMTIWDLVVTNVKPVLGSLTVGACAPSL
jgi:hypothetical protein